jgi:hypothetical protein
MSREMVFLDDQLVASRIGRRASTMWSRLPAAQVGTGFITPFSEHAPTPGFSGWYGFHGIVDNLRVWSRRFSRNEVAQLKDDGAFEDDNAQLFSL